MPCRQKAPTPLSALRARRPTSINKQLGGRKRKPHRTPLLTKRGGTCVENMIRRTPALVWTRYVLSELRRLAQGSGSGGAQICLALLEGAVRPDHLLEVLLAELGHGRRPARHQAIHDTLFADGVRVPVARHRVGLLLATLAHHASDGDACGDEGEHRRHVEAQDWSGHTKGSRG